MDGIIVIDKPKGVTSHDVVDRIRRISGVRRVGHGGTLDPLATGLLVILIGRATKMSEEVMGGDKEYVATIKLGEERDTDDAMGVVTNVAAVPQDAIERLQAALPKFTGDILQRPPAYSAIKKNGTKLYKMARKGIKIEAEPRAVRVDSIAVEVGLLPFVQLRIKCSKGTYIRALARDLGREIGSFAHIVELRRTRSGAFKIEDGKKLSEISTLQDIMVMLDDPPLLWHLQTKEKQS